MTEPETPAPHADNPPAIALGAINIEASDPHALSGFWASVTGGERSTAGDSVYLAPAGPHGFGMFFGPRTGPVAPHPTLHLDLTVPWGTRKAHVDRLVRIGARHHWDVLDEVPWVQWSTLADPEGNMFCVAEHPPTTSAG